MRVRTITALLLLFVAVSCSRTETTTTTETPEPAPVVTETQPPPQPELREGLQTPESVLYDSEQDVYFVSNINGAPLAVDDNGFISRVNAEDLKPVDLRFIDGAKADVTLNAPKGLAIVGDELWVSDITTVRKFDRKTGAAKGEVKIAGSTFLNDLAADGTTVYVSDSGMKAGEGGNFAPTGTDAIWRISGTKATKLASGKDLKGPNGLVVAGGKVWAASFGANEIYAIENGKKGTPVTLPKGGLDGFAVLPDGSLAISSWDGNAIYRGQASGPFTVMAENVNSPADFGFDAKRNRILIPHFMENRVSVVSVQ